MGGKAHGGKRVDRDIAVSTYNKIVSMMPAVESVILCGSARRLKPTCGDLDIVVVPSQTQEGIQALDNFFINTFGYQKSGKPAKNGLFDEIQTEFYVATPSNVGSFVQMWTGSAMHNVLLRKKANEMGYSLSQYGLKCKNTSTLVEFKHEEDLYEMLKIDFKKPEKR